MRPHKHKATGKSCPFTAPDIPSQGVLSPIRHPGSLLWHSPLASAPTLSVSSTQGTVHSCWDQHAFLGAGLLSALLVACL